MNDCLSASHDYSSKSAERWLSCVTAKLPGQGPLGRNRACASDPAVRQRFNSTEQEIPARDQQTPDALGALQKADIAKWWPLIKAAGIKAE
jgi:hypothetical protein